MAADDRDGVVHGGAFGVGELGDVAFDLADQPPDAGDLFLGWGRVRASPLIDSFDGLGPGRRSVANSVVAVMVCGLIMRQVAPRVLRAEMHLRDAEGFHRMLCPACRRCAACRCAARRGIGARRLPLAATPDRLPPDCGALAFSRWVSWPSGRTRCMELALTSGRPAIYLTCTGKRSGALGATAGEWDRAAWIHVCRAQL